MKKKISVLVPCFNEEEVIEKFEKAMALELKKLEDNWSYELVFVNDGSRDNTLNILKELSKKDMNNKYISFSRNFGKEAAMLAALDYCTGDCAIIIDADLQHPPALIHEMLHYYEEGYDQVVAKRNRNGDSKIGTFFARLYYKIVNNLVDVEMLDGAGDFRLLSRSAINVLTQLKENNRFSKGLFSWIGFKQIYIDYENQQRAAGETKWSFRKLLKYGIEGIMSFNSQPLRLCIYLGGIVIGLSVIYLLFLLVGIVTRGIDVPGYFSTIFIISLLGGGSIIINWCNWRICRKNILRGQK